MIVIIDMIHFQFLMVISLTVTQNRKAVASGICDVQSQA